MRARLALAAGVLAVGVAACNDQSHPTAPSAAPVASSPLAVISDGAHGDGNPHFFFLPPLVADPFAHHQFGKGTFNRNLRPMVRAFKLAAGGQDCSQAGSPVYEAALERGREEYHADWHTKKPGLSLGDTYRICVFSSPTGLVLGYLDVMPQAHGIRVKGGDPYAFEDDQTIPIKVRIEQGALITGCTDPASCSETTLIGPATGSKGDTTIAIKVPSGYAALSIPPDAVKPGDVVTIVIEKQAPPYGEGQSATCLPTDLQQSKGCWHFSSEPALYPFVHDVTMEICVDPGELDPDALRVVKYNASEGLKVLPWADPTLISCDNFTAMANPLGSGPSSFASAALRRVGQWAAWLLAPPPLYASRHGGVSKGLGGLGGSFSDVGGAVPLLPNLTFGEDAPSIVHSTSSNLTVEVKVWNFGGGSANNFKVSLQLWRDLGDGIVDSVTSFERGNLTLGTGANLVVTFTVPCSYLTSTVSQYIFKAEADPYHLVVESDETDNESPWFGFYSAGSSGSGYCGSGSF